MTWVHAGHGHRPPAGRGGIAVNGSRVGLEEPGRSSDVADQGAFAGNAGDSLLALRAARGHARRAALPRAGGFWLVAGVLFLLFFAAAAPSPLCGVYQAQWRFSAITLTAVFAVYALLLLITLLMFGSVSDYLGRRRVVLVGLAMAAGPCGLFLAPHDAGLLFAARALQGAAVGTSVSALGASKASCHYRRVDRGHGPSSPE
jgi:hypothetical protein